MIPSQAPLPYPCTAHSIVLTPPLLAPPSGWFNLGWYIEPPSTPPTRRPRPHPASLTSTPPPKVREVYRRKLEVLMRDVGDMGRALAIMESDRGTDLKVTPDELWTAFQNLSDENTKVRAVAAGPLRWGCSVGAWVSLQDLVEVSGVAKC